MDLKELRTIALALPDFKKKNKPVCVTCLKRNRENVIKIKALLGLR